MAGNMEYTAQNLVAVKAVKSSLGFGVDGTDHGVLFVVQCPIKAEYVGRYMPFSMGTDLALAFARNIEKAVNEALRNDGAEDSDDLKRGLGPIDLLPTEVAG